LAKVDPDFPEEKKFKTEDLVSLPTSAAEDDLRLFRSPHQQHHHQSEERRLTSPTTPNGSGRFLDRFPFLTGVDGFVSLHHDAVVIPLSLFLSLSLSLSRSIIQFCVILFHALLIPILLPFPLPEFLSVSSPSSDINRVILRISSRSLFLRPPFIVAVICAAPASTFVAADAAVNASLVVILEQFIIVWRRRRRRRRR
jgi:hypothetical protein